MLHDFDAFAKHIADSHRRDIQYPDIAKSLPDLPPIDPIPEPNAPILILCLSPFKRNHLIPL